MTQIEPIVNVYVKENEQTVQIIDLIIENVGSGTARNIHFKISPPGFITLSGDSLEKLHFFQNGVQVLAPKQKYVIHMVDYAERVTDIKLKYLDADAHELRQKYKQEFQLKFILTYENVLGFPKRDEFDIDLCVFWGLRYPLTRQSEYRTRAF